MSSSTHDNAFAFQTKVHLFVSPSRQTTLNSALQRALKHFNNACSTTRGSISSDPLTKQWRHYRRRRWNSNKTNLANKQATHQTSLFPTTDRKSTILNSFLIRPTYQISHFGKTQPSVDLVFKSSYMNWECIRIFQNCTTKYCRRSQRYSKRHKTSFSPLLKRKQSFSDHDDHKIQRWFLFFLFKSKTNKKGEEISNIQPVYEILQDLPTKLYSSAIWRIHSGLLFYSSLTKFHPKRCCHFFQRKTK